MSQIKNIKYTYYHYGQGPYQGTHTGYCPEQSSYSSVEDMLQKTHPDYTNIRVISFDRDQYQRLRRFTNWRNLWPHNEETKNLIECQNSIITVLNKCQTI